MQHLLGGIKYASGANTVLNYQLVTTTRLPEQNRFTKVVLEENLYEPTELVVFKDERVLFVERHGDIKLYKPETNETSIIAHLDVHDQFEDGLMGVALDPDFENNSWIYMYYSPVEDEPKQNLSRFIMNGNSLDLSTEKVILEIGTQRDECCHTGGSITFGPHGNLFLSTGDDTNPFASDGYDPIDERPGRSSWDAQRSSANTNDLRGKILRIKPETDGSYSIPEGNLFPADGSEGRPEIYVMGCRNPYRISVDQKTGFLYWGDVGPDAGTDSLGRGPRGHDEVNQAREPGNFGWPHFVGNNKAYTEYDFTTQLSGDPFDPLKPLNDSPFNSGQKILPPAQEAFIWYPYAPAPEFPILGDGGRTAMAGPVFYPDAYAKSHKTFPDYYDGKLFIYEWIRGWIMVVTMYENGDLKNIEPFMPSTEFSNPVGMAFARNGSMYLLEYGVNWNQRNQDARLVRIEYTAGNRKPRPKIAANRTQGAAPFRVTFSSDGSIDHDRDDISFEWFFGESGATSIEPNPTYTYANPGIYETTLKVSDSEGNSASEAVEIKVGNDPPDIKFTVSGNSTFFFNGQPIEYQVTVEDLEDGSSTAGSIAETDISATYSYNPEGRIQQVKQMGHQAGLGGSRGLALIQGSDCKACHDELQKSIGPSYEEVALKYKGDSRAKEYLVDKVINGGGGVWGEQAMAAHPQLTREDAELMVRYVLSLSNKNIIPLQGSIDAPGETGYYNLAAEYTDKGGEGIGPITSKQTIYLRSNTVPATDVDLYQKSRELIAGDYDGMRVRNGTIEAKLEVRAGSADGELLSTAEYISNGTPTGSGNNSLVEASSSLPVIKGKKDLYFIFSSETHRGFGSIRTIAFNPEEPAIE